MEPGDALDPSERVLRLMEKASGLRQVTCPWRAAADPYAQTVQRAYQWRENLRDRWSDPPAALVRGLEVYRAALNAVDAHDRRAEAEEREREREAAEREGPSAPGWSRPLTRRR